MKSETIAAIRSEALTEADVLQIVNAALCNFKPNSTAGDALLDCSLVLDDLLNNHPTLDDLPAQRADFKRRSDGEAAYELQRGMLDTHKSMVAVMRGYP